MKHNFLFILFCFFFHFSWGGDTLVSFHGSKIKVPAGFKEFSIDQLDAFKLTVFNRQIMTVYEHKDEPTGLQRIIMYYDSLAGTSNLKFDKIIELKLKAIKKSGIVLNEVRIDKKNKWLYSEAIFLGDTSMFGLSVDEFGIMGFQFDSSNGISGSDKKKFTELLKSIHHPSPYKYIPEENPNLKKANEEIESSGALLIIASVVMLLVWLIRKYSIQRK